MNKKWIGVIVLAVIGVIAAYVAIEYLSEPISKVPSYLGGHHIRGHFKKRGELAAVVAVIAFAGAAYLAFTITRKPSTAPPAKPPATEVGPPAGSTAESLLGGAAAPATTESAVSGESTQSSTPDVPPAAG